MQVATQVAEALSGAVREQDIRSLNLANRGRAQSGKRSQGLLLRRQQSQGGMRSRLNDAQSPCRRPFALVSYGSRLRESHMRGLTGENVR